MAVKTLNPYLGFNGTAATAIQHYESALGAKVENVMRWSDGPPDMKVSSDARDKIMHAELTIGGGKVMLADAPPHMPSPADSNITVCLTMDDNEDMKRKFDALGVGGQVVMPIHDAFWGATFGMLKDAYGIRWMFVGPKR
jgi:PhnB protein